MAASLEYAIHYTSLSHYRVEEENSTQLSSTQVRIRGKAYLEAVQSCGFIVLGQK